MTAPSRLQQSQILGGGPEAGEMIAVTQDLMWFRLVTPSAPLGGVNVWALRDGSGWAVVDTGFADADTEAQWGTILNTLDAPVTRIICTHFHPDHVGQVGNLLRRFDVPVMMTQVEWDHAVRMARPSPDDAGLYGTHLYRLGLPKEVVQQMTSRPRSGFTTGLPESCEVMAEGDSLKLAGGEWEVGLGGGHSPAPAILENRKEKLMIAGDQLLMRITPHVGVSATEPEADPLGDYFNYLAKAEAIDPETLVLPGHGPAFRAAGTRAREIADHHRERLDVLQAALAKPRLAVETIEVLFGRALKGVSLMLGLSEAEAHLQHLVRTNRAVRELDSEGRYIYRAL